MQHTIPSPLPFDADPCDAVAPGADPEIVQAAFEEADEIVHAAIAALPIPCIRYKLNHEGLTADSVV